ncbi:MAG: nickel-dependent hydrogenase large subunit [Magnetococcales bacterium]|nr:nickel-dependent hydrogenase large subunit [Magnetococcales bacterium]NGZ07185.1 nickel-dependent hydrogenase large subunit [Magnetococcales bacterium]
MTITQRIECHIPLNRVEGDLELRVAVEGGRIVESWSSGTMYRGFERMLVGRAPLDSLVITPRICGICTITHLTAAVQALDQIFGVVPPSNAVRMRNLALMIETIQSDIRQSLLMFLVDLSTSVGMGHAWHAEAQVRYQALRGIRCIAAVKETKRLLEIIALLGGQWPHTSFMVPGGVVYAPPVVDFQKAVLLLRQFRNWYEQTVLGCGCARWLELASVGDLEAWLAESASHRQGDVGFLLRAGRDLGLDRLGIGSGNFLSYGALPIPVDSGLFGSGGQLVGAGFVAGLGQTVGFEEQKIAEHVACSWYADYPGGLHPMIGITEPVASGAEGKKYSWVKAPRYAGLVAETGPVAERVVMQDPLFMDLARRDQGVSALTRQLARLVRPAYLFGAAEQWLHELIRHQAESFYLSVESVSQGEGVGLTQAARGALGHWVKVENGQIAHYQIITPTAWNGSPRDEHGMRGAWEQALLGTPLADPDADDPVLAGMVVRSFDPCLVCSVHVVDGGGRRTLRP